eukprot:1146772-Pelagomonas_calceolata.AAC.1
MREDDLHMAPLNQLSNIKMSALPASIQRSLWLKVYACRWGFQNGAVPSEEQLPQMLESSLLAQICQCTRFARVIPKAKQRAHTHAHIICRQGWHGVLSLQNAVDNKGRSRMEDLRVTLDQPAYVSFGVGAPSHRGNINVLAG